MAQPPLQDPLHCLLGVGAALEEEDSFHVGQRQEAQLGEAGIGVDDERAQRSAARRFPAFANPRNAASGGLRQQLDKAQAARARALATLETLGAIQGGRLTRLGEEIARLPLPPRVATLLVKGARLGIPKLAARAAAFLAEGDPQRPSRPEHSVDCDLLHRLDELFPDKASPRDQRLARVASDHLPLVVDLDLAPAAARSGAATRTLSPREEPA